MFGSRKSVLAVDVGSSSVKILEVQREGQDLLLTGFARVEVAGDTNRSDAVSEALRRGNFGSKRSMSSVSGKSVIVRYLTMVRMSNEELQRAVAFEAEKYIPWPIEESQVDAVSLGDLPQADASAPPEMRVLLVASKKSYVTDHAQMLVDQGLSPVAIDVDALAIGQAFELHQRVTGAQAPSGGIALIDLGATKTCINVLAGGVTRFTREVDSGGQDMTQAVSRKLAIEPFEAERVKCAPGEKAAEVEEAITPAIADLANELTLSFDYFEHQGEGQIEAVYLSGGGSLAPSMAEHIERATGKKTHMWNPIEGLKIQADGLDIDDLNARAPSLAVAVGLAAREL